MRSTILNLVVGRPGSGKTTFLKNLVKRSRKKVLVLDVNAEEAWEFLPRMKEALLPRWQRGNYRIHAPDMREVLLSLSQSVYNAALFFDDASIYLSSFANAQVRQIITQRRHRNLDLFFVFHSLQMVPPDLYRFATHLTLFKTLDTLENLKNIKKLPNFQIIANLLERVKQEENPYFCLITELF